MKITIALITAIALFSLPTFAGQETQTCTNNIAASSTNTIAIPTDITGTYTSGETVSGNSVCSGGVRASQSYIVVGGYFRNTSTAANVTFRIAGSGTGSMWTNGVAVITVNVPATSTNYAATAVAISNPYPFYSLRAIENPNAAITGDSGTAYLKVVSKTGL